MFYSTASNLEFYPRLLVSKSVLSCFLLGLLDYLDTEHNPVSLVSFLHFPPSLPGHIITEVGLGFTFCLASPYECISLCMSFTEPFLENCSLVCDGPIGPVYVCSSSPLTGLSKKSPFSELILSLDTLNRCFNFGLCPVLASEAGVFLSIM